MQLHLELSEIINSCKYIAIETTSWSHDWINFFSDGNIIFVQSGEHVFVIQGEIKHSIE